MASLRDSFKYLSISKSIEDSISSRFSCVIVSEEEVIGMIQKNNVDKLKDCVDLGSVFIGSSFHSNANIGNLLHYAVLYKSVDVVNYALSSHLDVQQNGSFADYSSESVNPYQLALLVAEEKLEQNSPTKKAEAAGPSTENQFVNSLVSFFRQVGNSITNFVESQPQRKELQILSKIESYLILINYSTFRFFMLATKKSPLMEDLPYELKSAIMKELLLLYSRPRVL